MKFNRRSFIKSSIGAGVLTTAQGCLSTTEPGNTSIAQLDKAASTPVLKVESITSPVKIASIELAPCL